jgi:L-ascorbate metabolism protein UlaG (beta-lactamase superfamily)
MIRLRLVTLASLAAVAAMLIVAPTTSATEAQQASGPVNMEWFGWSFFRFTSPGGKVVLTNPFAANPDSPIKAEDVTKADLIVTADGHGDEVGSTVAIAQNTGAQVLAPGGLNRWLIEQGVPQGQIPKPFFQPGDRYEMAGITVRSVASFHGSELAAPSATIPYGGVAAGYFITFENGWTVYFSGSTPALAEQALWAQMYKPDAVILHMGADHEPMDFAMQVKLLQTENPNLKMVIPHHNRVSPTAGQTTVEQVQAAMDALGVGIQVTQPNLSQAYSFNKE